jgi:hypothetical protein
MTKYEFVHTIDPDDIIFNKTLDLDNMRLESAMLTVENFLRVLKNMRNDYFSNQSIDKTFDERLSEINHFRYADSDCVLIALDVIDEYPHRICVNRISKPDSEFVGRAVYVTTIEEKEISVDFTTLRTLVNQVRNDESLAKELFDFAELTNMNTDFEDLYTTREQLEDLAHEYSERQIKFSQSYSKEEINAIMIEFIEFMQNYIRESEVIDFTNDLQLLLLNYKDEEVQVSRNPEGSFFTVIEWIDEVGSSKFIHTELFEHSVIDTECEMSLRFDYSIANDCVKVTVTPELETFVDMSLEPAQNYFLGAELIVDHPDFNRAINEKDAILQFIEDYGTLNEKYTALQSYALTFEYRNS